MKKHICITSAIIFVLLISSQFLSAKVTPSNTIDNIILENRPSAIKTMNTQISSEADILRVIVKFKEKTDIRLRNNQLISLLGHSIDQTNDILKQYSVNRLDRLIKKPESEIEKMKNIHEARSDQELADFNLYYTLEITDPKEAEQIVNDLNRLDIVEIAYAEPRSEPAEDIDPPTPDWEGFQTYLLAAPYGVDAIYANALPGGDGAGVKIIDIEHEWNESHEDLDKAEGGTINGGNSQYGDHGTAVLGEMIAGDNAYGVTGICPGADVGMASAAINGTTEAMLMAVDNLEAGDLMLIELHAPGPRYNFQVRSDQLGYVCMEYWQANFDALQYAWAKGIIVIEAAGNGAENFDDVIYGQLFDTTYRNSHAIMAGAGAPPSGSSGTPLSRLGFSNNGERVNLQSDGREVFTTGYGGYWDGDGDANQWYTSTFGGTSSASPIVTGAVACLQGYYMATYGVPMTSDYAREVLAATGTPQQGDTLGQHIGPKPNLAAAIPTLSAPPSLFAEPMLIDTSMEHGTISTADVYIYNRYETESFDFAVTVDGDMTKDAADWLQVSPASGTIGIQDSIQLTVTLDASLIESGLEIFKGLININWGYSGGSLDSLLLVPIFLEVPCAPDSAYDILSSGDPEGPVFQWQDIAQVENLISQGVFYNSYGGNPLDDGTAGPISIPFDFPFYDSSYNQIYVGINGGISFTDSELNSTGYYSSFNIPGSPFQTCIPVFWNDLIIGTTHAANGNVYFYASPTNDSVIIEWYRVGNFNSPIDTSTTFQVILTSYGNITMQYLDVGLTGLENTALIGASAADCNGMAYVKAGLPSENIVANATAVIFDTGAIIPVLSGDANGDGSTNILDITYLITFLYMGGTSPDPFAAGDVNCNLTVNILDITYLIAYLYQGGPIPCFYQP